MLVTVLCNFSTVSKEKDYKCQLRVAALHTKDLSAGIVYMIDVLLFLQFCSSQVYQLTSTVGVLLHYKYVID